MKKPILLTGLDIGSSKIAAVAAEVSTSGIFTILAYESRQSKGVLRGGITDIAEASNSVAKVLAKLSERISRRPDNIYANISGETVKGEKSRGMIPLSYRGREVTNSDITKCINAASTIRLTFDREVIHKIVSNFSIDDQPSIKSPLGLYASRLSCEMYMITAGINHIQNIYKCVNNAGHDLKEVVYSGIADGWALLEDEWKDDGVMLLNFGATLTENSIFYGGNLNAIDIITVGSDDIKGNLRESAEFNGIISRIKLKAEEFTKKNGSIKLVIVTGGLAFSEGTVETLEENLPYPVKMAGAKSIQGNISSIDSLRGITAIGLARYAAAQHRPKIFEPKNLVHNISNKVVEIFNNYF